MRVPREGAVLLVDKPEGPTSHDVVARARKALGTRRVGHTGTLDPFASGLLVLVVGPATRLSPFLTGMDKGYEAEALLGTTTDSLDRDGEVVEERGGWEALDAEAVAAALATLVGDQMQEPPALSAKKIRGEAAHRRVRRGEDVRLEPVPVTVSEIRLLGFEPPTVRFSVRCSSGTYVRGLARDLGERLGTGAHLRSLRRTGVGAFDVARAASLQAVERGEVPGAAWFAPGEALAVAGMPSVTVGPDGVRHLVQGRAVDGPADLPGSAERVAIVDAEGLVAVAEPHGGRLRPRKVFRAAAGST